MQKTYSKNKWMPITILGILAVAIMYYIATAPDQRSAGDKISDAVSDAGDDVKRATNQ